MKEQRFSALVSSCKWWYCFHTTGGKNGALQPQSVYPRSAICDDRPNESPLVPMERVLSCLVSFHVRSPISWMSFSLTFPHFLQINSGHPALIGVSTSASG